MKTGIFFSLLLYSNLLFANEVICQNGLAIFLTLDEKISTFSSGLSHIKGQATINNPTPNPQSISTEYILLSINGSPAQRGYNDSVASNIADFGNIQIQPGKSLNLNMYWPVSLIKGQSIISKAVSCVYT